ncbi:hypothetical protein NC661_18030 [Aquibacillus koreensis]|uniref:HMA domain-containing protein n=1 Tax=Aquibacillus koreensis TaxID=279446 RepID=A0A9X3WM24_9BACI|nr:hypothetical protein [Aquibacillus koreensis]MCT2535417.1 hypothetical protein [Aquibacillus koreensis]MDC3422252.1 hypothetical protein [Aquibacillus koreensis]
MSEETFYIRNVIDKETIQEIEKILNQVNGMERVLIDTDDGEVKVEFYGDKVMIEEVNRILEEHRYQVERKD